MEKKLQRSKSPRQASRLGGADQQAQLALAQQLGIPPEFLDPGLMSYPPGLLSSGMDPQMLNPMAAGYPFMNPAALQAFTGLGALGNQAGSGIHSGAVEWWNLAQNQALAASLGAGFYPGMLPPGFPPIGGSQSSQKTKSTSSLEKPKDSIKKLTDHTQRTCSPFSPSKSSPRPGSSGTSTSRLQQDRKRSNDSQQSSSKERPESRHSLHSPFHSSNAAKHSSPAPNASWADGLSSNQQKLNEQVFQAEIMRQLEQQFLVQQFQLQQQQQQDQLTAALQSVMPGSANVPSGSSSCLKKGSSNDEKMQQQLSTMLQQIMQTGGPTSSTSGLPQGISQAVAASMFSTPGALETMMAMNQIGNMNALAALSSQSLKQERHSGHRDQNSPSSSQKDHPFQGSSKGQKLFSSSSPSSSRNKAGSSSPKKVTSQSENVSCSKNNAFSLPMDLSPDNALLAALYSQQLQQQHQYEALIKQELEAVNRLRDQDSKPGSRESSKSRTRANQDAHSSELSHSSNFRHEFATPSSHSRSNLYSPANSSSSRGKSRSSPHRDASHSPSRKIHSQERSHSRGSGSSSTHHLSPSRWTDGSASKYRHGLSQLRGQESMSETLRLLSSLASNPNLTQQDLTSLLGISPGTDMTALLSGMNALGGLSFPPGSDLLNAGHTNSQMTPNELEKLNKDLAAALAFETQRLEEQLRHQKLQMENTKSTSKKEKQKDNHVSVIHQNNLSEDSTDQASSSTAHNDKGPCKRSSDKSEADDMKIGNGAATSSEEDVISENGSDKNNYLPQGRHIRKRRRVITNEDEILEPLKHGWRREVRFKFLGNQLRGEVIYISPNGKKFRTYPDVIKHLEDNEMKHLNRNNFSFSSRLRIGSFYEQKDKGSRQWTKMTEEELEQRIQQLDGYRSHYQSLSPHTENTDHLSDHSSSAKNDGKQTKKEKDEREEQLRLLEQEKEQKHEQQRIEREIRERIAIEERQKLEEARKLKFQEALLKAKELERQRMAEALDRDQRRQQMLLMRALESRKRAEERERRREEIRIEKLMQREKKMEQRRIAMQIARELKMPVEDMSTIGAPELPQITMLQGTLDNKCPHQLSGNACADLLMVLEFVKTFKECLRIEDAIIPSIEQLQRGILNDPCYTPCLVQLTMSLLHQCLCDPGVPAPGPWLHCLTGVKVTDIDVTEDNYSEILRLFIWARSGFKTEISLRLETLPFPSLTTDEKAQSLAFLVNELVCSRPICVEIEKNLDTLATLRRDKWMVEGQMRQLRVAHEKNVPSDSPVIKMEEDENSSNSSSSPKKSMMKNCTAVSADAIKEEPAMETTQSLFQKKMAELTQQHNSYNTQLVHNSKPLRALDLGQDRYKRRYWVLPNLGGVYVEGLESGISYEDDDESPDEEEDEEVEQNKNSREEICGDNDSTTQNIEQQKTNQKSDDRMEESDLKMELTGGEDEVMPADMTENSENDGVEEKTQIEGEVVQLDDQSGSLKLMVSSEQYSQTETKSRASDGIKSENDADKFYASCSKPNGELMEEDLKQNFPFEVCVNAIPSLVTNTAESSKQSSDNANSISKTEVLSVGNPEEPRAETDSTNPGPKLPASPLLEHAFGPERDDVNTDSSQAVHCTLTKNTNGLDSINSSVLCKGSGPVSDFYLCDNIDDDSTGASPREMQNINNSISPNKLGTETDFGGDSPSISTASLVSASRTSLRKQLHPVSSSSSRAQGTSELDVISLARLGALRDLKAQDDVIRHEKKEKENNLVNDEKAKDNILIAAKAIAAKAVASSSHLLFPKDENSVKATTSETEISPHVDKANDKVSSDNDQGAGLLPIGTHTINALVQMGVNPTSLTSQQLEVLSHPDSPLTTATSTITSEVISSNVCSQQKSENGNKPQCDQSANAVLNGTEATLASSKNNQTAPEDGENAEQPEKKLSVDQDTPMDLSFPANLSEKEAITPLAKTWNSLNSITGIPSVSSNITPPTSNSPFMTPSGVKLIPVKQDQNMTPTQGSPVLHGWDGTDMKAIDNKFFIPISFPNNVKMDPAYVQQNYNQIISSCPSPNTLANYIVSSANYSQFPSLEDIKFPIRAPDVKEEADAIPREKKRGWWRMRTEGELRSLSEKLHLRGIREKQLHRNITKNFEVCTNSMNIAALSEHQFAVFTKDASSSYEEKTDEKTPDLERVKKTTRASSQERKNDDNGPNFSPSEKLAFNSEMRVLYQVEELSVRCCNMAVVSSQWRTDNPRPSMCRKDLIHVPLGSLRDAVGNEIKFDITNPIKHDPRSALGAAVDLIGCLERAVCRRYLKPPLVRKGGATEFSSLPSLSESGAMDVAAGLRTWRNAVAASSSASQLSLCVRMLETCIAWDRSANSPVKVDTNALAKSKKRKAEKRPTQKTTESAEIPGQPKKKRKKRTNPIKNQNPTASNDSKKSKQLRMPIDTADVISKTTPNSTDEAVATNKEVPLVNGDRTYDDSNSEMSNSNLSHVNTFDDSVASNESGGEVARSNGSHDFCAVNLHPAEYHTNSDNVSEEYKPNSEAKKKKKKKKSKKSKTGSKSDEEKKTSKEKRKTEKDTVMCRGILRELQSHEAATWFLFPVDCKLVPGYRKIIKRPIDFHTIECRLKKGRYKTREEFVAEVRLVFDNCQKFNEDDSNIGRAGHDIREFFERRWAEVLKEKYGEYTTETAVVSQPTVPEIATNEVSEVVEDNNTISHGSGLEFPVDT